MKKSVIATVAAYVIWGVLPIYWKLLIRVPPVYILCDRIVFSCVFMLLLLWATGKLGKIREAFSSPKAIWFTVASSVLITVNWFTYIWAVNNSHVLDSSLGYYINPLMVFVFSVILFKEKSSVWEYVAVGLAAAGVLFMTLRLGRFPFIALTLAISFTLYGVCKKLANLDAAVSLTLETVFLAPFALAYMIFASLGKASPLTGASTLEIILLLAAGVITATPLLLYAIGIKGLPLSIVGFFQYICPTMMFLFGTLLYGEPFDVTSMISFALIWVALIVFTVSKLRQAFRKVEPAELERAS